MQINYVKGDATNPVGHGPNIIVHVCNDIGAWGKGFVLAISKRWLTAEQRYRDWHKQGADMPFELGQVQFVEVEPSLWVANLIGQRGIRPACGVPPIRYESVRNGLRQFAVFAQTKNASVHMPRIGCGLAGGTWEVVGQLVQEELANKEHNVYVYDFQ